jgi:hypothetical protein
VNPNGEFIAGPLRGQEGILYAEIDPVQPHAAKCELDVAGHYARPDVFQLTVHTGVQQMITAQEVVPLENTQSSEVAAPGQTRHWPNRTLTTEDFALLPNRLRRARAPRWT